MLTKIIKRDGSTEEFIPHKLNKWSQWAGEILGDRVDWGTVVLETVQSFNESTTSKELQYKLIDSCLAMGDWPHNLMAGRLLAATLHKEIYPDGIPTINELIKKLVSIKIMVPLKYSDEEYAIIEKMIDHRRDFNFAQFQIAHIKNRYSLSNRFTEEVYETAQFTYMRLALVLAEEEPDDVRLKLVKDYYDCFSFNKANLPTPDFVNLGTGHNGLASCCLIHAGDNVDSIGIANFIAYRMTAMTAGIGYFLNSRSMGDPVRKGTIIHQGKLPYKAYTGKGVKANLQKGRGGACTDFTQAFDPEAETTIQLQSIRSTEDKQNRDIHFALMFNKFIGTKAMHNEDIFQFNSYTAPDLFEALYGKDINDFIELYNKYENDDSFKKTYINARKLVLETLKQSHEVATNYYGFIDEINRHTPFLERIYSSNLCVAPETKILTTDGYITISDSVDKTVNIWNGVEFSETIVRKTSDSSLVVDVVTEEGYTLPCTEYHKFYINNIRRSPAIVERKASQLSAGMKTIDFDLPFLTGSRSLNNPYINGFYSGSGYGTPEGARITLYGDMRALLSVFKDSTQWKFDTNSCYTHFDNLEDKYFIPSNDYTVDSRLNWLSGLADSAGFILDKDGEQSLVITSLSKSFLTNTGLMLQSLGVLGRISNFTEINEVTRRNYDYQLLPIKALTIDHNSLQFLLDKGLEFKHHKVEKTGVDLSRLSVHLTIKEVINKGRMVETYCFTEPNRNMGMFNGMLAGNCMEITQPTYPYFNMTDLYEMKDNGIMKFKDFEGMIHAFPYSDRVTDKAGKITFAGNLKQGIDFEELIECKPTSEVSLCSLGAVVISNITSDEDYANTCYLLLKKIDKCIHLSDYPLPHVGWTAKNRMNAGVGIVGLAYHLAKKGLRYDSQEGLDEIHRVSERHAFFLIQQSLRIAKERGVAPWIHKTRWPEGWLPIDTYKKTVDELSNVPLQYDWENLRKEIIEHGGIAHSSLIAHMPTETSSKASGVPNGLYPIRELSMLKSDYSNVIEWCAPDSDLLAEQYDIAWNVPALALNKCYAVVQKFSDQSISADSYADRIKHPELSTKEMLNIFFNQIKYGQKTQYYQNSLTKDKEKEEATDEAIMSTIIETTHDDIIKLDTSNIREKRVCSGGACDV